MAVTRLEYDGPLAVLSLTRRGGNRINFAIRDELNTAIGVPTDELRPRIEVLATALARICKLDISTVATVQGDCAGGGFERLRGNQTVVAPTGASEAQAPPALYDTSIPVFDTRDAQAGLQAVAQAVDAGRPFSRPNSRAVGADATKRRATSGAGIPRGKARGFTRYAGVIRTGSIKARPAAAIPGLTDDPQRHALQRTRKGFNTCTHSTGQ